MRNGSALVKLMGPDRRSAEHTVPNVWEWPAREDMPVYYQFFYLRIFLILGVFLLAGTSNSDAQIIRLFGSDTEVKAMLAGQGFDRIDIVDRGLSSTPRGFCSTRISVGHRLQRRSRQRPRRSHDQRATWRSTSGQVGARNATTIWGHFSRPLPEPKRALR